MSYRDCWILYEAVNMKDPHADYPDNKKIGYYYDYKIMAVDAIMRRFKEILKEYPDAVEDFDSPYHLAEIRTSDRVYFYFTKLIRVPFESSDREYL